MVNDMSNIPERNLDEKFELLFGSRVKNESVVVYHGEKYIGDFKRTSLKRSKFKSVVFAANYYRCALTDSNFSNVVFDEFNFELCNLQFCYFENCNLKNEKLFGDNLDNSVYHSVRFDNIIFECCGMSGIKFVDCSFAKCGICSATLESTIFINCSFEDCDFTSVNIEYCTMRDCIFKNILLPISQAPYIIGFSDFVSDSELKYSNDERALSYIEMVDLLPQLRQYYFGKEQYFPTINILMSERKYDESYAVIKEALGYYIKTKEYRLIKHICSLATYKCIYEQSKISELFNYIRDEFAKSDNSKGCQECLKDIKITLLEAKYDLSQASIYIDTDIDTDENELLNKLQSTIDDILANFDVHSKKIEIRHNSPYSVLVTFSQIAQNIPEILLQVNSALGFVSSIVTISEAVAKGIKNIVNKKSKNKKSKDIKDRIVSITIVIDN